MPPRPLGDERRNLSARLLIPSLILFSLPACRAPSVRQLPLEPAGLPTRIEQARELSPTTTRGDPTLTFGQAATRLRAHNPRVADARAAALGPQALARTPTPLPNPTLALGPVLLTGLSGVAGAAWGLESALGWSAVLGGKRQMLDSLHAQEARSAVVNAIAVEREEYLGLRNDWLDSAMRAREEQVRAVLLGTAETARDGIAELVQAQSAAAVDLVLLDLDARRLAADQIEADAQTVAARAQLAQRIGADTDDVPAPALDSLPPLPAEVPSLAQLRAVALAGNPRLDRLRAEYTVAEQRLRLEASRAIPDLKFGGTFEHDDLGSGLSRFGLPLGIELPIFDRNQKALAEACAERDALRARFHAEYTRILGEIESARALLVLRRQRILRFRTDVSPAATAALETGKQALLAGQTDALRFVNLLRSTRVVEREQIGALRLLYLSWSALERAVGGPLLRFPDEPTTAPSGAKKEDA